MLWRVDIVGESCGGVDAGSNVESLHPSELLPLSYFILVAFGVFLFQEDGESPSNFEDFVDDVVLQAETRA